MTIHYQGTYQTDWFNEFYVQAKDESESDSDDEYYCLVCGEDYLNSRAGEKWITCPLKRLSTTTPILIEI